MKAATPARTHALKITLLVLVAIVVAPITVALLLARIAGGR
ncbi:MULTISPECIES: hypothetical protein [unclassified Sphingomonas]|nr:MULTISPECIES: hypothetical protein [unclassified Sphingomonas]